MPDMKEKSRISVSEKKILKILSSGSNLSKSKIMSVAKMPRQRTVDSLDSLVKGQFLNLQDEKYEITKLGFAYLEDMEKRDKQERQMRKQTSGRV